MTTERSGRNLAGPAALSPTMTIRTRLEDRIVHSSAETSLLVVSDSHIGSMLATEIDTVRTHLVTDSSAVAAQTPDSVRTTVGDVTVAETLASGADATAAVVALQRDRQALLVAQLLRTKVDTDTLVVLLNDPSRRDLFDDIATFVVCVSTCLSAELRTTLEQTLSEPL
ncbi:potassium transporter [Haloarcula halophila]|uniref:potassium transporter n=2 Tax=Haloarcula TaxID=2237 RepID=UPI0023E3B1ED|nr:potassium transporter [Halomicroarcula sp. DFY41]